MPTIPCPRCAHVLEYSREAPRFCSSCGVALSPPPASPAEAPTLPPLPTYAQATVAYPRREAAADPDRVGGYRLLRALGGGGMGTVYEAEQLGSGRHVALKLIRQEFADSPGAVERFRREGRLASALLHPRCVFVLAADEEAGRPYIVMELMPGQNLLDVVERNGPLPVAEAVRKILDVIEGLQEAHRQGVIHRDVKPSNCFLDEDGRVKVGDFGLAKSLLGPEHLTRSGSFLGTVLFASPEQIRNENVGPQADLYSVCATLFYLLTGRAPFQDEDAAAALARTVSDPAPSMRQYRKDVPKTLDEVVLKGLARSRKQRWQNLEELRLALVPFLDHDAVTADLGWRASAYLLDLLLLIPLVLGTTAVVRMFLPPLPRFGMGAELLTVGVSFFCGLLYFALPEWRFGGSVGKLATRLRVRDAKTGDRPSLGRSLARTACFYLFKDSTRLLVKVVLIGLGMLLSQEGDVSLTTRVVATTLLAAVLPFLSSAVGFALLASTMRRRNGYRGVHELLSGTRVIRLPAARPRFHAQALAEWSKPGSLPPEVPERVGGFAVHAVARATADERLLQGEDGALHRPVWIWQRRETANTLPVARREAARDARPHWLAGGCQDGWSWDVFVAAPGGLLADLVAKGSRLSWPDALAILEPLAAELEEAEKDGTLPGRLSPEQVWVQASGRVLLLDAPPREPTPAATPLDLLRQAAAVALEGRTRRPEELRQPIRAPVPGHAAELLARLMGAEEPFAGVAEARAALAAAHAKPEEISQPRRGLQVAAALVLHGPGLLWMFGMGPAILLLAYLICVLGQATADYALERGEDPARAEWDMEQLALDRRAVLAGWSWFATRNLPAFEERLQSAYSERLQHFADNPDVDDEEAEGFDYLLAHGDDATAGPSWLAHEALHEWWLLEAMVAWPLLWALWAAATRGGVSPRLAGIVLMGADGRPAARWRCGVRELAVWLPVALLLLLSLYLDMWRVAAARSGWSADAVRLNAWVSWHLWWGAMLLVGGGVFTAVCWPNRGPHDRLTGVYPVPR